MAQRTFWISAGHLGYRLLVQVWSLVSKISDNHGMVAITFVASSHCRCDWKISWQDTIFWRCISLPLQVYLLEEKKTFWTGVSKRIFKLDSTYESKNFLEESKELDRVAQRSMSNDIKRSSYRFQWNNSKGIEICCCGNTSSASTNLFCHCHS